MRLLVAALCLILASPSVLAWNAAGHRLAALIAWQQLSPASREYLAAALRRHPDHARWEEKSGSGRASDIFAEAATWPDHIRDDRRFYDEGREPPTPPLAGLPDTARHKDWHYVDVDRNGRVQAGQLDQRIEELNLQLPVADNERLTWALPWLAHLVADLHQPLHVGHHEDHGGNDVEIENPFNRRLPFTSLHSWWDDLPGPPWLRGKRLHDSTARLLERHPPPAMGNIRQWREESWALLDLAYPDAAGSLLPIVSADFRERSRQIAERRVVAAGYRLGWLLEAGLAARVSRETQ
jgi:hypothetical protein